MARKPRFTEDQLRAAVAGSKTYVDVLRALGMTPAGGNAQTIKRWVARLDLSTAHFDPYVNHRAPRPSRRAPLEEILVKGSGFSRGHLKTRLYEEGLKEPRCEMCGQDENWRGARMSLILDHINRERDDHRLENLRIVCPNCAATLDTHCGRHNRRTLFPQPCRTCGREFTPTYSKQRTCSVTCWHASDEKRMPRPESRKVERPAYDRLLAELEATSFVAVGRKYGVSDNAVRKWVHWYEVAAERKARQDAA